MGRSVVESWSVDRQLEENKFSRYRFESRVLTSDGYKRVSSPGRMGMENLEIDSYHSVFVGESFRPDILAYNIYGNAAMWWVVLMANRFVDPFSLIPGVVFRVPAMSALQGFGGLFR